MSVEAKFTESQLDSMFESIHQEVTTAVKETNMYVGESSLRYGRDASLQTQPYTDQTGNLRSSVGYISVVNGDIVESKPTATKGGVEGAAKGAQYARSLIANTAHSAVLFIVAGMSYASYVQARGYDVLHSMTAYVKKNYQRILMKRINKRLQNKKLI